jgi:two-component system, NtrC family, nitrogen regulation sensor histidine kinase NtrY
MGFRSYQLQILLRLILLAANCYAITYVWLQGKFWFTFANLCFVLIIQIFLLFRYLTRWQKDLSLFTSSVRHGDFNITYNILDKNEPHFEMYQVLNEVSAYVRKVQSEYVQQNQYFQYLVQNVQVGLMAYDDTGKILLSNNEALKLLGRSELKNIHDLKLTDQAMYAHIATLALNQPQLISLRKDRSLKLSARVSKIVIGPKTVMLLSMLNIRSELEANELQSWQELISVLTHEIMNSVTPIHSLSGSMAKYLDKISGNGEIVEKAKNSLEVINRRSQSLMTFVERYRTVSTVPLPHTQLIDIANVISSVVTLLQDELSGVQLHIIHQNEKINADFSQIEQVLINLLKNALHALKSIEEKQIAIEVSTDNTGIQVALKDNGVGINPELMDKIFIPFFTTRTEGSGIGLTLSRQIMHRHGGSMDVVSRPNGGTTFILLFPKPKL